MEKIKKAKESNIINLTVIPFEEFYSEDLEIEDQNNVDADQEDTPKTDKLLSEIKSQIA